MPDGRAAAGAGARRRRPRHRRRARPPGPAGAGGLRRARGRRSAGSSSLRKLVEDAATAAALPCYRDEARDLGGLVRSLLAEHRPRRRARRARLSADPSRRRPRASPAPSSPSSPSIWPTAPGAGDARGRRRRGRRQLGAGRRRRGQRRPARPPPRAGARARPAAGRGRGARAADHAPPPGPLLRLLRLQRRRPPAARSRPRSRAPGRRSSGSRRTLFAEMLCAAGRRDRLADGLALLQAAELRCKSGGGTPDRRLVPRRIGAARRHGAQGGQLPADGRANRR